MNTTRRFAIGVSVLICIGLLAPRSWPQASDEGQNAGPTFKPEEIEQLVAPIALYPDSLISQILMASTYPLEVVEADRWLQKNKDLAENQLTDALEKQTWDPSVKSLVGFPQVLDMMNEKLEWTQKLGDAFLAQQKDVLEAIQSLRKKAQQEDNLKTTEQQVVKVEQETIIIESANPQVVYVPSYDPVVVYGAWPYPAYPPSYYYPPGYVPGSNLFAFGAGVAVGAAWGYAWGHCDWHGGDIDIDVNRNFEFNQNINRNNFVQNNQNLNRGQGTWQHNPENRKGVAYRDQGTAQKYNRASTSDAIQSRESFRGRAEQGRQDINRGNIDTSNIRANAGQRGDFQSGNKAGTSNRVGASDRAGTGSRAGVSDRAGTGNRAGVSDRAGTSSRAGVSDRAGTSTRTGAGDRASTGTRGSSLGSSNRGSSPNGGAFQGMDRGSGATRSMSNRGSMSRQGMSRPSGGFGGGGGGGRMGGGGGGRARGR